jgi:SAM-dependent methyltransferase
MDLDSIGKERWNDTYVTPGDQNLWGEPPVPFVETAAGIFAADSARVVLDLPCGDGRNLPPLASRFPAAVGADSSANALGLCGKRMREAGLDNTVLLEADIFGTKFVSDTFDGVFCCEVLGHLREPVNALRELIRVCRPGHHVVANVFALEDSIRTDSKIAKIDEDNYLFAERIFFHFYDENEARALCEEVADIAEARPAEFIRWMDPPHAGYRDYDHEHASWLLVLRKHG